MTITTALHANIREMYLAHRMFRREFGLMPALVSSVRAGDHQRSQIITRHVELVNSVLYHHHHAEDKHLWPKLLARGAQEISPIVHTMEIQHENIDRAVAEIAGALRDWSASATSNSGRTLANAVERLIPRLTEHMNLEEAHVLHLVEKYIRASEWDLMIEELVAEIPQEDIPLIFGMMMYEGDPDVVQTALLHMPPEIRSVMQKRASQAFASHAEQVYGTATPPRLDQMKLVWEGA